MHQYFNFSFKNSLSSIGNFQDTLFLKTMNRERHLLSPLPLNLNKYYTVHVHHWEIFCEIITQQTATTPRELQKSKRRITFSKFENFHYSTWREFFPFLILFSSSALSQSQKLKPSHVPEFSEPIKSDPENVDAFKQRWQNLLFFFEASSE